MSLTKHDLRLGFSEPFTITAHDLLSCVISGAINCQTYPIIPRKIDIIAEKIKDLYEREFEKYHGDFYMKTFNNVTELYSWIEHNILVIPEIRELNLSQKEFDSGIDVDDENRSKFIFTSSYDKAIDKGDDFVDLDSLARNIGHHIIKSYLVINFSTF